MVNSYIGIDLETTGLNPRKDRILEIGAIKVIDGEIISEMSFMVNPRCEIPKHVTQLTGITWELVEDGLDMEEGILRVIDFTEGYPLLGHNVLFDYSFLKRWAVNQGKSFDRDGIDTYRLVKKLVPEMEKKNLKDACNHFGISLENSHRALADAKGAHLLYQSLASCYGMDFDDRFMIKPLLYKVKREQPATKMQKQHLIDLAKYHRIEITVQIDYLTRNEASRLMDKLILKHGRMDKKR